MIFLFLPPTFIKYKSKALKVLSLILYSELLLTTDVSNLLFLFLVSNKYVTKIISKTTKILIIIIIFFLFFFIYSPYF